jgi:HD-GYP domain-containing protein (c-di-GMP phosphodiesterase class II)
MRLPNRHVEDLWRAALLHDLGKVAIASSLWGTLGALTDDQRALMEAHVRLGYQLAVRAHLPEPVLASILHHHERWDGRGYPDHISEDVIPLKARILSLAEQVDAMMRASYRREPLPPDKMLDMLEKGAGRRWDPMLTRHMIRLLSGR